MIAPNRDNPAQTLFTIGYEGLDLRAFLKCLSWHKIDVLIDVRELAFSRKKGFSKSALCDAVEDAGLRYVHIRELGSPRDVRHQLKEDWDYEEFFEAYKQHLDQQGGAVSQVLELVAGNARVCLMCFEKEHEKCHRSLLASFVAENYDGDLKVEPVKTWVK